MKTYKIIADNGNVYPKNTIITANTLIEEYLECCNTIEDADLIGWLNTLKETNTDNSITMAINFITEMWGINLEEIKEKFLTELNNKLKDDLYNGYTTVGPHRDDINILINGMKAKNFGSQGQQRSAVLSLKLSEATVLSEILEEKPVLLLDDVLSELDSKRQDYLLNKIDGYQVFITCCEHNDKKQLQEGKLFVVNQGKITEE